MGGTAATPVSLSRHGCGCQPGGETGVGGGPSEGASLGLSTKRRPVIAALLGLNILGCGLISPHSAAQSERFGCRVRLLCRTNAEHRRGCHRRLDDVQQRRRRRGHVGRRPVQSANPVLGLGRRDKFELALAGLRLLPDHGLDDGPIQAWSRMTVDATALAGKVLLVRLRFDSF